MRRVLPLLMMLAMAATSASADESLFGNCHEIIKPPGNSKDARLAGKPTSVSACDATYAEDGDTVTVTFESPEHDLPIIDLTFSGPTSLSADDGPGRRVVRITDIEGKFFDDNTGSKPIKGYVDGTCTITRREGSTRSVECMANNSSQEYEAGLNAR